MKRQLLIIISSVIIAVGALAPIASAADPKPCTQDKSQRILLFPAWYKGLDCDDKGHPTAKELNDLWKVALNIVEWLIVAAAYLAVAFITWGGFKYMKSRGEPGKLAEAKTAILQAVIGLGIALISVAIVEFVSGVVST